MLFDEYGNEVAPNGYLICDLDGTVANLDHRLGFVKDGAKNWDAFFKTVGQDKPINDIIDLVLETSANMYLDIVFCTGRPDICREDTIKWIEEHMALREGDDYKLLMRPSEGSDRYAKDCKIKQDMLEVLRAEYGKDPKYVFDDRDQVVEMWRSNGVRVLQVANGDF